uniref:Uncharacterized protein n=1 Tax=Eutreptiella gymnastica TaxID=73025 RepID=A0A7S4C9H3_9EUGL
MLLLPRTVFTLVRLCSRCFKLPHRCSHCPKMPATILQIWQRWGLLRIRLMRRTPQAAADAEILQSICVTARQYQFSGCTLERDTSDSDCEGQLMQFTPLSESTCNSVD